MDQFPGPQPRSIERRHFELLRSQPYVVCEKTDGVRYILRRDDGPCELVNRAFEVTPVSLNLPRQTVLDGELVTYRTGRKMFVVHDAMLIKGQDITQCSLTERLNQARQVIRSVILTPKSPFGLTVKNMIPLEKFNELPTEFPYETDGLVFTPVNEPVRTGTHETMFKWKPHDRITIDFLVRGRDLYIQERGQLYKETEMHVPHNFPDDTIVECGYGELGWTPVKARTDKTHPNNRRTYLRTLVNLRENIGYNEFKDVLDCTSKKT
jgi:ATP-dependent DNA ligase